MGVLFHKNRIHIVTYTVTNTHIHTHTHTYTTFFFAAIINHVALQRREQVELSILYKLHYIFILKPPLHYPICSYDFLTLIVPFSNTCAHANSFVLSTSSLWNSLNLHIKSSSSLHSFRIKLLNFSPNVI